MAHTTTGENDLERLMESTRWTVRAGRRVTLSSGERLRLRAGTAVLAFVDTGRLIGMTDRGCGELPAGAALIAMGRSPVVLSASEPTRVMTVELESAPGTSSVFDRVPNLLSVTRFAQREPVIAALAREIGDPGCGRRRAADGPICSLMVTTVALAAIRAWVEGGCAPEGWPARAADPFLARVLDAIHEEPGREWSVGSLAAIGAMSRSVFADRFRAATGRTPAAYLGDVRIDTAKSLLADGAGVSDTARRLGFASDEGFSRAFRRRTGVAPSRWRYRAERPDLPASENSTPPAPVRAAAIA